MRGFRIALVLAAVVSGAILPPAADAAFPGENGKIAYTRETFEGDLLICTIDADGTDKVCPPATPQWFLFATPVWSPDGQEILYRNFDGDLYTVDAALTTQTFVREDGFEPGWSPAALAKLVFVTQPVLATSNVDGSGFEQLPPPPWPSQGAWMPDWSPDGKTIVFQGVNPDTGAWDLFLLTYATGEMKLLTENAQNKSWPDFSPDGSKVLYTSSDRLYSVSVDGTGLTDVGPGHRGRWSPDGTKIVFTDGARDIYIANADGSNRTLLDTRSDDLEEEPSKSLWPDWQPLPVNTASSHPRPAGATPLRVPLVPAARQCTVPNRTHAPPLAFPSCNPPVPESPNLTVGVGDGNPARALSIGFVRLSVRPGVPGGADDAEVVIRSRLSNVMRASDLSEYPGALRARLVARLTDKQGVVSQTTQDFPLEWEMPCASTTVTTEGSLCEQTTTLDALIPAAAAEGTRANWALDQVKVYDGGPDEDASTTADNSLLATQGVFVP